MIMSRMQFDPRTVARDIPGIFDTVFPQLTPGVVAHFNRSSEYVVVDPVDYSTFHSSSLQAAMLSELAFALGERRLSGQDEDWGASLTAAANRQRKHFDAAVPESLTAGDMIAADALAGNLVEMVRQMSEDISGSPLLAPKIPGFQWIASGVGDLAIGSVLIEVKFGARRFSAADYRQVVIYWLLTQLRSLESDSINWTDFVLVNPRLGQSVRVRFSIFVNMISSGRTIVEVAQVFSELVASRGEKA